VKNIVIVHYKVPEDDLLKSKHVKQLNDTDQTNSIVLRLFIGK